jgi:hypothetical protein
MSFFVGAASPPPKETPEAAAAPEAGVTDGEGGGGTAAAADTTYAVQLRAFGDHEARKWVAALRELQDASKEKRAPGVLVVPEAPATPTKNDWKNPPPTPPPANRSKRAGSAVVEMEGVYGGSD